MEKKVRIICVGGGWVTTNRHVPALKQSGLFDLLGVVSHDRQKRDPTLIAHEFDPSNGLQAEAEAVMIGTDPKSHFSLAKQALLAGKHVLCEKPLCVETAHADELCALAKERNLVLGVVHNFQFARCARAYKADLEAGRIGRVKSVYAIQFSNHQRHLPRWYDDLPMGLFFDEAPHFFYLFNHLVGAMTLQSGSALPGHGNTPLNINARFQSTSGIPVFLHLNFDASLTEWHVIVVGENAILDLDVWRDVYVRLPNDGDHRALKILKTTAAGFSQHWWGVLTGGLKYVMGRHLYGNDAVVRNFYQAIRHGGPLPGMSGEDGRNVVALMDQLARACR